MSPTILIFIFISLSAVVYGKDTRVAGGKNVPAKEFPYLVSIKRKSDGENVCGGAIISERHVITSGQCFDEDYVDYDNLIIRAGTLLDEVEDAYLNGYTYEIDEIYVHPEYVKILEDANLYHNNLAILRTKETFVFSHSLNRIELSTKDVQVNQIGTLSGWGKRVFPIDPNPRNVRKAWMMIVDNDICAEELDITILIDQFCAFQVRGVGACVGDSGAPLVIDDKLVGIVSLFEPCATGVPDVYTDVSAHAEFIHSILHL